MSVAARERNGERGFPGGRRSGAAWSQDGRGRPVRGRQDPPFESPYVRSVHGAVVQLQQAPASKLGQQRGVQAWPDTSLGPVPQPSPSRRTGAAHGFRRNVAPGDTGSQRVSRRRVPLGREPAGARGGDGVVRECAAAAGPRAPTDRPEQDQYAPGHLAHRDRQRQDLQLDLAQKVSGGEASGANQISSATAGPRRGDAGPYVWRPGTVSVASPCSAG